MQHQGPWFNINMIPLKMIPKSWHLPEMPAKCQALEIWLPLMALTLHWHCADFNCLFSWPWWHRTERALWPTWYKIRKQNTKFFTDTIVIMRVAKDAVDADILINNVGTFISRVLRDATFCKSLHKFADSFALNSEYLNDFYTPVWKTDVLCRGNVHPSVRSSVRVFRTFL